MSWSEWDYQFITV